MEGRHSKPSKAASTLFGLILLAGLVAGAGYVIYLGVRDAPSIVGALVTALGAVLAVVAGRIYETKTAVEQKRRERMAPLYEHLVETFYNGARGKESSAAEMEEFFEHLSKALWIWGPPKVIRAFNDWKQLVEIDQGGPQSILAFEMFIRALRDDLGTKNGGLDDHDLLRLVINDFDEMLSGSSSVAV